MNNTLKDILGLIAIAFLIFVAYIAIQLSLNNLDYRATVISGVFSMFGGMVGAFGAYKAAVWQTKKAIERDQELRVKEKKVQKLEELKSAFVSCHLTLDDVYEKVSEQNGMVKQVLEKGYTVFKKENFITPEIENEFTKGLMQLQSFKFTVMNNKEYVPVRIDSLELFTAIQRMTKVLNDLQSLYEFVVSQNANKIKEFEEYWLAIEREYQDAKEAVQAHMSDNKKHIESDIQENL